MGLSPTGSRAYLPKEKAKLFGRQYRPVGFALRSHGPMATRTPRLVSNLARSMPDCTTVGTTFFRGNEFWSRPRREAQALSARVYPLAAPVAPACVRPAAGFPIDPAATGNDTMKIIVHAATVLTALMLTGARAQAETRPAGYPARQVRIIVPYPPAARPT